MLNKLFIGCLPVGLLILLMSHTSEHYMSMHDFVRGFFDGLSLVFMVAGLIYIAWHIAKKENPFRG